MNQSYIICLAAAFSLCSLWTAVRAKKAGGSPLLGLALLIPGAVIGLLASKLFYMLFQLDFVLADGFAAAFVNMSPTTWCFWTGCAAVCGVIALFARPCGLKPVAALDVFAPAGALLVSLCKLADVTLMSEMTAWGDNIEEFPQIFRPFFVMNEWGESYLAVFAIEFLAALVVVFLACFVFRKDTFLRTVVYLCLAQIICESLHSYSISWLFVRVEQLLSILPVEAVLLRYSLLLPKEKLRWMPPVTGLAATLIIIGIEFALDKSSLPVLLLYVVMLLCLGAIAAAECWGSRHLHVKEV